MIAASPALKCIDEHAKIGGMPNISSKESAFADFCEGFIFPG